MGKASHASCSVLVGPQGPGGGLAGLARRGHHLLCQEPGETRAHSSGLPVRHLGRPWVGELQQGGC